MGSMICEVSWILKMIVAETVFSSNCEIDFFARYLQDRWATDYKQTNDISFNRQSYLLK